MEALNALDTRISDFLQAAKPAPIDLGSLVKNAEDMGLARATALAIAQADGDKIYALIRSTAANQDGRTNGITVPSRHAQEMLIRQACRDADISPGEISYVEAHGTGTPVGDPIEPKH